MKKLLLVLALGVLASAGGYAIHTHDAHAYSMPVAQSQVIAHKFELTVAAGAVVNSGVITLDDSTECTVLGDNSAGGSTRNLIANWLLQDGVTVVYSQLVALATTTRGVIQIAATASAAATLPTGVTVIPVATGRKMSFSLSTAGAAAGSLAVYCK